MCCFGEPGPPRGEKRPETRESPALAGRWFGILFYLGAGALHGCHCNTLKWECN